MKLLGGSIHHIYPIATNMKKTLSLINSFWHEIENLPKNKKYLITAERGAFCQCGTERFIEITKNPIETRSFLMIGILIDQTISHGSHDLHDKFRTIFRYPRLRSHPTGQEGHPPSWFAYNIMMRDKVDWLSVRDIYETLFIDTKNWFLENNQIENFDEFKKYLMSNAKNDFKDFPEMLSLSEEIVN